MANCAKFSCEQPRSARKYGEQRMALTGGESCPHALPEALAHATDTYFTDRIRELDGCSDFAGISREHPHVLLAVGGYGRRELCPGSDIDLVLVFEKSIPDVAGEFVRAVVYPLWDLRLDVGHGVRTVTDCVSLSRKDPAVLASLLDARPLAGDAAVFARLQERFFAMVRKCLPAFTDWLQHANVEREARFGDAGGLLEPQLKNGLGGLRDINQILWLSQVRQGGNSGPFLPHELAALREDCRMLLRVRSALHMEAGRKLDTLAFDLQPGVARRLGYLSHDVSPAGAGRAVEFFLSRLHRAMNRILAMREALFQEVRPANGSRGTREKPVKGVANLLTTSCGLRFADPARVTAEQVLDMFVVWARTGLAPVWSARRIVAERAGQWGAVLANQLRTMQALLNIFLAGHGATVGRGLAQTGLLSVLVPEFGAVRHLVQFNDYHVHPVGRHTLETVAAIAGFLRDKNSEFYTIGARLNYPERLILAALFHDLGKESPDHSIAGADIVREVLSRHGRAEAEIEDVAFLVRHHLLVPSTATRRDLSDEAVVARVASLVEEEERLDALYLLSVADSMATGPRAWSHWTASLFSELYSKAREYLRSGDMAGPLRPGHMAEVWQKVLELTAGALPADRVESMLESMPPRAFLALSPETLARHMSIRGRLACQVEQDKVRKPGHMAGKGVNIVEVTPSGVEGCSEVTIAALDRPGLFATVAGVLALHNLDILSADIFTWSDNTAMDVFTVIEPRTGSGVTGDELWARVSRSIMYALTGRLNLASRLEDKRNSLLCSRSRAPKLVPVVNINNAASGYHTVVEAAGPDRKGLLHDLARVLGDFELGVVLARITTIGGQAADVFHVLEPGGRKLAPEKEEPLRKALLDAFD